MLSWCNAFELPKFWMWNGGTFWHSFVGHVMMYTCIMGLGSECMDHYVQFGSCTWSKSILYINISRYKSFTNVYQTNVPCWGTAYVWTSRCCLKTHTTVGHGSWGLIHGQNHSELMCWMRKITYLSQTDASILSNMSHVESSACTPLGFQICSFCYMFNCCAGAIIDWTTKKNTAFADHLLKTLGKGAESCQGIQQAARCASKKVMANVRNSQNNPR